jgi:hypothetical protein
MYVGYEVIVAVVMKGSIFWNLTACSPFKVNRRFEGTYRLHLQCRRIREGRNQHEATSQHHLTHNGLHGLLSHKRELFKIGVFYILLLHYVIKPFK